MEVWQSALREVCGLSSLLWLAIQDKKHLEVSRWSLVVSSMVLLIAGCFSAVSWQWRVGGMAFGVILLLFVFFSKEALGVADGVIIVVCGIAFGLYETVLCCFLATVYTCGYALFLLLRKKAGRKTRIPFLPFYLLGYITLRVAQSLLGRFG